MSIPTISKFMANGSNSPPKRSYSASCLEADNGAWKVDLYLRTISESTVGEPATTLSFRMSTH